MTFFSRFFRTAEALNASAVLKTRAPDDVRPPALAEIEAHSDFLSQLVAEAMFGASLAAPSAQDIENSRESSERGKPPASLEPALDELLSLVRQFPHFERFQVMVGRLLEVHRDPRASAVWRGIDARFPRSSEAFRLVLRWAKRDLGNDRAQQLLNNRYPEQPTEPSELIAYARACEELRDFAEADDAYARMEQLEAVKVTHYMGVAQTFKKRGEFHRALSLIDRAQTRFGKSNKLQQFGESLHNDVNKIKILLPNIKLAAGSQVGKTVLDHVLRDQVAKRVDHGERTFVGPVVAMSASLGCGGAERQFVNTITGLQSHIHGGGQIAGYDVLGPVTAICRSLRSRNGADFFAPALESNAIPIMQYVDFPDFGSNVRHSVAREMVNLLRYLPPSMAESVRKASDVLASIRPDILHIWQDGSVLANCISALLADVPRIVLSVRSVPPVDRPERNRDEYAIIYKSLLSAPSVILTSNSQMSARRYADWLDIDPGRVRVIHNGSEPLSSQPKHGCEKQFAKFDATNTGSSLTVGSVFRFDENKRPFLWLDAAAALLHDVPDARFILVGEGPLLQPAKDYAMRLGIADSVLFVGRSDAVGYWLSKMDVFLLLSRFEGLPNVLIEAQYAGVPVVTTDAGGAGETITAGRTGTLLSNLSAPEPAEIVAALRSWQRSPEARKALAADTLAWARSAFSTKSMLEKTVHAYMDHI